MSGEDPKLFGRQARSSRRDSRSELIDVTLEVLVSRGIDGVRIDEICDKVGVTKGSLYWHFQDREGLIREALLEQLRRMSEENLTRLDEAIAESENREEYLARVASTFVDPFDAAEVEARWQRWELLTTTRRDPELSALMSEVQRREQRFLVSLMEQAREKKILRSEVDPKAMAAVLVALSLGSNNLSLLGDDAPTAEHWTELLVLLVNLLFPPGEV